MKISIKGVRGSIPTSSPETSFFGGHTSCVTVKEGDWQLILDGGSGIQKVSAPEGIDRLDILLTHLHMDHIQGLGFFNPLFDPSKDVHIWAPVSATQSLRARLNRYLSPPLFPVHIRDLPCKLTLHDISNSSFEIGPFVISSKFVIHPGPTVGFRVSCGGAVMAYIPDHEPALGPKGLVNDPKWISGFELAESADLLLHDAQFTKEEYKGRIGWGHSCMEDSIQFAGYSGAKRLLMTHHDPSHSDSNLKEFLAMLKSNHSGKLDFGLAREGMEIELG
ncbi:MBL fold metallo-hydrolase [Aquiflexum gelatinilyticum]|uniref:MBL fold metallo-hydrolase n=1 Tax=Aquiflexum gelatinilyticum TaxID=2961943 RepID=UPI00216739F2|nr:MBL fold metallo-hydrolase [Aquiflexum gelatinilyticum]MCS4434230.1 MBL fold metallo-hydrolase [Aquiflexum gelatinilyticum]